MTIDIKDIQNLIIAANELLDSINFDDHGALLGGKWMGGHGGLISKKTFQKSDALRRALYRIKIENDDVR